MLKFIRNKRDSVWNAIFSPSFPFFFFLFSFSMQRQFVRCGWMVFGEEWCFHRGGIDFTRAASRILSRRSYCKFIYDGVLLSTAVSLVETTLGNRTGDCRKLELKKVLKKIFFCKESYIAIVAYVKVKYR